MGEHVARPRRTGAVDTYWCIHITLCRVLDLVCTPRVREYVEISPGPCEATLLLLRIERASTYYYGFVLYYRYPGTGSTLTCAECVYGTHHY